MAHTRRTFLKTLGIGAGALAVQPMVAPLARALASKRRHFIFAYMNGGWDTLMSLDPRDPAKFTDSKMGQTGIQLAWDQLGSQYPKKLITPSGSNITWGPMVGPFAKHYDVSCVVNGINMDTVTHQVGMRYFITGKAPRGLNANGSSIPTYIASQQGDKTAVPSLVSQVESYNEVEPSFASGLYVSSVSDLLATFRDGPQAPDKTVRKLLESYRDEAKLCDPVLLDHQGLMSLIRTSQKRARTMVTKDMGKFFNFLSSSDPEMRAIKARYNIRSASGAEAMAAMAFQAIKLNVSQCVTIRLAAGLDTHFSNWRYTQPSVLQASFKALSVLVDDLKKTAHPDGGKYIDHTTIAVFSEFGRQGKLNSRGGRDHSVHNSCLLIGAGVPHNKVVGATSDKGGLVPMTIDPKTGKPSSKTGNVRITPGMVWASVMKNAGFNYDILRVDGLPCLKA